jgi:hypothetical protein
MHALDPALSAGSVAQYTSLHGQLVEEVSKDKKASNKKIISLARQNLSYCHEHMNRDLYIVNFALNLNSDNQQLEALDVTNRCLEINDKELFCLAQKADALLHLGRVSQ